MGNSEVGEMISVFFLPAKQPHFPGFLPHSTQSHLSLVRGPRRFTQYNLPVVTGSGLVARGVLDIDPATPGLTSALGTAWAQSMSSSTPLLVIAVHRQDRECFSLQRDDGPSIPFEAVDFEFSLSYSFFRDVILIFDSFFTINQLGVYQWI